MYPKIEISMFKYDEILTVSGNDNIKYQSKTSKPEYNGDVTYFDWSDFKTIKMDE